MQPNIVTAKSAGFCFGVKRAVELITNAVHLKNKNIYMLGELIHNRDFSNRLYSCGVKLIQKNDIEALDKENSLVFIRAHGETKETLDLIKNRGLEVIDATCPYVSKIHDIVSSKTDSSSLCIIIGSKTHPEVIATASYCNGSCKIFNGLDELKSFVDYEKSLVDNDSPEGRIVVVSQTTHGLQDWQSCADYIRNKLPKAEIFDTVCKVTQERQDEILQLSKESELVIVIGGKNSANTAELYKIAAMNCKAYHIENAEDLKKIPANELRCKKITITAGASTPEDITQEVIFVMAEIIEEISFAEMLNDAFKTLHMGERVTGTVSMVSPAEIHIDLGTKHTGIMPYDEAVTDSSVDLDKEFHVGDKIDVVVVKFNDSEGTVLVSKKRFDADKNWNAVEAAAESNEILTGKVKEAVKGGVIVNYSGIRVFVPASQTGLSTEAELKELVGQETPFRIIETNPYKKRVIGSIKSAKRSIKKQQAAQFYETVEVGMKMRGTVRSLTSFGAFVDLGGVDGMIHITELTWGKFRKPSDIVSIGDEVDVTIKEIDKEKKRISLVYKTEEDNPWNVFISKYNVGDIVTAKVVSIMTYGAFATVIDGLDGLIHISQIAPNPVNNIKDYLTVGDEIEVQITGINEETHKVNLSRRAVLENKAGSDEAITEDVVIASSETENITTEDIVAEDTTAEDTVAEVTTAEDTIAEDTVSENTIAETEE